jgi:nascent polypeptide-associated complex subunit beta
VRPEAYASIQNNTFIVSGEPETKTIKDLLPDIIQQLGPKQHKLLQELVQQIGSQSNEEVPNLVESDLNKV